MTLKELREKLTAKQDQLHQVFEEAKVEGQLEPDFTRVKCLGAEVKGSLAVSEKVRALNVELESLAEECESVEAANQIADKVAAALAEREKAAKRPPFPAGGQGQPGGSDERAWATVKSLGELVTADATFEAWLKSGAAGGHALNFDEVWPSDLLAKGAAFPTLGSKALFATTAGWAPESLRIPGVVEAVTRPVQLLDIIPMAQTGVEQVVYMEETTRTHAAAETAEGGAFAESTFTHTEQTSAVRKITDSVPVTDEQLEDVAQVGSYLNGRLIFGVRQRLDLQLLVGNGTPPNLRGIKNTVGIQTQAKGLDPVPDAFFKAMTKIRITGRAMPTHHIIHPTDWEGVRLLRTADGIYIWGNPSEPGPERMWGLPVVQNDAGLKGTGYVGSFLPSWISLFERRGVDVQIGFTGSQFVEGKRTIRADARFAFVVFRPAAFASVTGL